MAVKSNSADTHNCACALFSLKKRSQAENHPTLNILIHLDRSRLLSSHSITPCTLSTSLPTIVPRNVEQRALYLNNQNSKKPRWRQAGGAGG